MNDQMAAVKQVLEIFKRYPAVRENIGQRFEWFGNVDQLGPVEMTFITVPLAAMYYNGIQVP